MEKIYLVIATYHNLNDMESILGAYKNAENANQYARNKQNEISVEIIEIYVKEEILKDTYQI